MTILVIIIAVIMFVGAFIALIKLDNRGKCEIVLYDEIKKRKNKKKKGA